MEDGTYHEDEIVRLREDNERLRARTEELEHASGADRGGAGQGRRGRTRWVIAAVMLALGGVLLAAAVPAVWAARTLLDTDRYTETVAPLAAVPAVRESIAVTAVDRLFARGDVDARVQAALPPSAAFLAPNITAGLRDFSVTNAERALATPQFQQLWTEANRRAHQRVVPPLLSGSAGRTGALSIDAGTVSIDMTTIVAQVKQTLVSRGLTVVANVPDTAAGGEVTLFQSARLGQVQTALRALQSMSIALPIIAVLVLAASVAVAPDRRRALLLLGVTAIVAMLALGAGLALLRDAYVSSPPAGILSGAAAAPFFDTIVRFLRNAIRTVAAVGLVLLVGAALAGPSRAAVGLRAAVGGGMSALGLDLGRPSEWTDRHRRALDVTIVVIAAAVLFATNTPTPGLVLVLAIAVLAGLALVELLARAHPGSPTYHGQPSA